jgi:hypothetical protein
MHLPMTFTKPKGFSFLLGSDKKYFCIWGYAGWCFSRCGLFMQLLQGADSLFLLLLLHVTVMYVPCHFLTSFSKISLNVVPMICTDVFMIPFGLQWAPCHAVVATPLLVAFELLLCIYLESSYGKYPVTYRFCTS